MDNNKEKSESRNYDKKKLYNQEIEELKESYKLGKEYYKNVEEKIDN